MKNNISPHVNIYKFPITAISSITNRVTGLLLTGSFLGFGLGNLCGINYIQKYNDLNKFSKKCINCLYIYPLSYHTLGGLRHIIWDKYPHLITNPKVGKSSYYLFGSSVMITFFIEKFIEDSLILNYTESYKI